LRWPPERLPTLLLVAALEVERGAVGARIHLMLAELDDVVAARDFLPDGFVRVEMVAALVDITKLHRIADADFAAIRLSAPVIILNSVDLPAPFGPMTPTMPPGGSFEIEVFDQQAIAKPLSSCRPR
jgi:hypothetical protein